MFATGKYTPIQKSYRKIQNIKTNFSKMEIKIWKNKFQKTILDF
jgi:hypothetical protein